MPDRLTPLEVSLLAQDTSRTPGHLGAVHVFAAPVDGAMSPGLLTAVIAERVAYVPRYRQRVRDVPARLAGPVWVDDEHFDLDHHVRRWALPRPGTAVQLRELAGQVLARRLDRSRPLWEVHVVEGLQDGGFALVTKTHPALVDGLDTVDLAQVLLDTAADVEEPGPTDWRPRPEPTPLGLLAGAGWQAARDRELAARDLRGLVVGTLGIAVAAGGVAGGLLGGLGATLGLPGVDALRAGPPGAATALVGTVSRGRRTATVALPLTDLRRVGQAHRCPVHGVVLAVVTGGLRSWLLARGAAVPAGFSVTALVPVSVSEEAAEPTSLGHRVVARRRALPVGEADPLARLDRLVRDAGDHPDGGHAVPARSLAGIAGFAAPTLHAAGVRAAPQIRRPYDLVVSNAPGPQRPVYAAGARMTASYPVLPLTEGHRLSVGATSYDGTVHLGLHADRDAVWDLDVLARCLAAELTELSELSGIAAGEGSRP